jgi:DNA-binding NarL/FixJ family response regulator/Tfp pilus assembly protein PilF
LSAAELLTWFWQVHGHLVEGRRWLALLLAQADDVSPVLRAEGMRLAGFLALAQTDYLAARVHFEESLRIGRTVDDPAAPLGALSGLGAVAMRQGNHVEARQLFEEVLGVQRELQDQLGMAESLNNLAVLAHERGDLDAARSLYEESTVLDKVIGYRPDVPMHNLAIIALELGDLARARELFEASVEIKRALADPQGLSVSLSRLGEIAAAEGNETEALRRFDEALSLQMEMGDRGLIAFILERRAVAAASQGEAEAAFKLGGAASALRDSIGQEQGGVLMDEIRQALKRRTGQAPGLDVSRAWDEGRRMPFEDAVSYARSRHDHSSSVATIPVPQNGDFSSTRVLTPREREVAALVAQGLSNRQIAARLVVSERTADVHVSNILHKLDLSSRAQLAAWAVRAGLAGA